MYTVKELASKHNMSPGAIRRLCAEGKLPHIKIGVKVLINDAVFEEFIKGTTGPQEPAPEYSKIRRIM